jgi:uncharacterized membrane protein
MTKHGGNVFPGQAALNPTLVSTAGISTARIVAIGRLFFALGIAGIGFEHFFFGQFIPVVIPLWPGWIPGHAFWVYCVGALLLACAGAVLAGIQARVAAFVLGCLFLLSVLLLHVPARFLAGSFSLGAWTDAFKALTLSGGAFVVAGTLPKGDAGSSFNKVLDGLTMFGMYPVAVTMIVFGIDHFLYMPFVVTIVPAWLPWRLFWAYLAGAALIAGGLGMIVRVKARLAAALLGSIIFLWVLVLHIPRAAADLYGAVGNELTSVFEALAFSGICFVLGQMLPKNEWLLSLGKPVLVDGEQYLDKKHSLGD